MLEQANERRNHARIAASLSAHFGINSINFSGIVDSLSFGGARISSPQIFQPGTNLKLQIKTPRDAEPIEASACVAWADDKKMMGVQFVNLQTKEVVKLENLGATDLWD
jgi:hypothetical protein